MNTDPKSPRVLMVSRVVCVAVAMIVGLMGTTGCGKPSQESGKTTVAAQTAERAVVNEMQIKRIIDCWGLRLGYPESEYIVGKDIVYVRDISEYDTAGNLVKWIRSRALGPVDYSIEELMADTALFDYTGGKSVKDWVFIENNNKITNKIDTLEIETSENGFGERILVGQKGNRIIIFELTDSL